MQKRVSFEVEANGLGLILNGPTYKIYCANKANGRITGTSLLCKWVVGVDIYDT